MTRGLRIPAFALAAIALVALLVPLLPLADPLRIDLAHKFGPPSLPHPLGQDQFGRDELSRLLWGASTALGITAASVFLACLFGFALGLIGGIMRWLTKFAVPSSLGMVLRLPLLPLALLIVSLFGPGVDTLIPMLAVLYAPRFARVVYAGMSAAGSKFRAILVGFPVPIIRAAASVLLLESSLSFLGLGVMPPTVAWGRMIGAASAAMSEAPLLLLWPCAALSLTLLVMNALGDSLRDASRQSVRVRRHAEAPPVPPGHPPTGTAVLDVRNLTIEIDTPRGVNLAVSGVSFAISAGETLAIVGAGGAGKSLMALAIMGLLPDTARVRQGNAWLQGHDLLRLDQQAFRRVRGGVLSMTFQDALTSFNPMHRIGAQIAEIMHAHFDVADYEAKEEVAALLARVGIANPERCARAYPHQLSAEMRQRAMIAMAIANDPRLLIVDEPTAGLDATVQGQILDLLADLRRELGMGLLYLSRSLSLAARIADRTLVMHGGELIEQGAVSQVPAGHPSSRRIQATISASRS